MSQATQQDLDALHDDIIYPSAWHFVLVHLICLGAIWTGVRAGDLALCGALYLVRMFGVSAGYHRYFSHRTYHTSRVFQFLLAFLCQTSAQKGVLWWAAKHREHHRHSDSPLDVHSPRQHGFWFAHLGWIFAARRGQADYGMVKDLARFPELVWLDRHRYLPAALLALTIFLVGGWPSLIVGFFWSTVLLYHGTFFINSLAHVVGRRRYLTGDDSRNNWFLALITLGEGWHNNHHCYQASTRQGFRWWEIDISFYLLKLLSWVGLVWDLRAPPAEVVRGERPLPRPVVERAARQLLVGLSIERIAADLRTAWGHSPTWEELSRRARETRAGIESALAQLSLPHLPSREELLERARRQFAQVPSRDKIGEIGEIVERARQLLLEALSVELFGPAPEPAAS